MKKFYEFTSPFETQKILIDLFSVEACHQSSYLISEENGGVKIEEKCIIYLKGKSSFVVEETVPEIKALLKKYVEKDCCIEKENPDVALANRKE